MGQIIRWDNAESPPKVEVRDNNISQKSLAKFVLDNNGVTHVPDCKAYIVKGHNEKQYCVTLHPEACQCPSMSRCYHIIAVKMFVGLPVDNYNTEVSLRSLSKRSLKRSDKKSGRKRPVAVPEQSPSSPCVISHQSPSPEVPFHQFPSPPFPLPVKKRKIQSKQPVENKLPVKKRKLSINLYNELSKTETRKWISNLTMDHKEKIETGQPLCSDIINAVQQILKQQFADINGLQQTERTPVWGDQLNTWKYGIRFQSVMSPAVQIHHNGKFHWVASMKLDGQIYVLDSLSSGKISPSLQIQLASMYGSEYHQMTVRIPQIQQQTNSVDCGLFAIANAVQFCFSYYQGSDLLKFDAPYLRQHLVHCLEKGLFSPFPRIETKAKLNKKKVTYVDVPCDCKCRLPNLMQEMIGCDAPYKSCSVWRHRSCAGVQDSEDWFCTPHRN